MTGCEVGSGVWCIIHNISQNSLSLSLSCSQHIWLRKNCSYHFNTMRECKFSKSQIDDYSEPTGDWRGISREFGDMNPKIVRDICFSKMYCYNPWHVLLVYHKNSGRGAAMTIFYFSTLPFLTVGNLIKGDRALNSLSRSSPATKIKFSTLLSSPLLSLTPLRLKAWGLSRGERTPPYCGLWLQTTSLIDFFPENSLFWY